MKFLKIFFVLILALVLAAVCFACNKDEKNIPSEEILSEKEKEIAAANAQKTELEFIYVSDMHFMREEEVGDYNYNSFKNREISSQKINYLSEAIFKQFCDEVIASGVKTLLIGGDINETGSYNGHLKIVEQLDRLRFKGIKVFVVPGNHDINKQSAIYTETGTMGEEGYGNYCRPTMPADFASIYANYGFSNTNRINVGEDFSYCGSLSYTVDLDSKYTLIAVDNATTTLETAQSGEESAYDNNFSPAVEQWIITQVQNSVSAGKTPLLMMHKPLSEIFTGLDNLAGIKISGEFINSDGTHSVDKFAKKLDKAGLDYCFVGHMHSGDIMCTDYVKDDSSFGIVQFMNCALTDYDCGYYDVKFKADYVETNHCRLSMPKADYLPSYLSKADRNAILGNWDSFIYDFTKEDFALKVLYLENTIKEYLATYVCGIDSADMSLVQQTELSDFVDFIFTYLQAPIYTLDKKDGETSLEELLAKYGYTGTLPSSSYKSVFDVILTVITKCFASGEKDLTVDSAEWVLTKYGIYGLIATLVEGDMYGLMESCGVEIENVDSTPMISKLVTTGILDLETYSTIDNLLLLPVLASIESELVQNTLETIQSEGVWTALGNVLNLLGLVLGIDIRSYFVETKTQATDEDGELTGEIYMDKLMDELVFGYVGNGLFYDDYSSSLNVIINRTTGKAYDK